MVPAETARDIALRLISDHGQPKALHHPYAVILPESIAPRIVAMSPAMPEVLSMRPYLPTLAATQTPATP